MKREGSEDDHHENKRTRRNEDTVRILILSKIAGAIIGKGGQHIQKMRSQYKATVSVDDSQGPERTISISADLDATLQIISEMLKYFEEERDDELDFRLLIHQSLAGCVIGKGGQKIKEIRDKIGCRILKVFSSVAPQSTDRVVQIVGSQSQIVDAVREVVTLVRETPIKGNIHNYDPINFNRVYADEYGGYGTGVGTSHPTQRGGSGGGRGDGSFDRRGGSDRGSNRGGGGGGGRGGDRGAPFINPWSNDFGGSNNGGGFGGNNFGGGGGGGFGNNNFGPGNNGFGGGPVPNGNFNNGGNFGGNMGGGNFGGNTGFGNNMGGPVGGGNGGFGNQGFNGPNMGNGMGGPGNGPNFGGNNGGPINNTSLGALPNGHDPENSTQVTIPKDMAGAIIGKGGGRIRRIRTESNAYITIDEPLPGSNDRIITISGTPKQIQMAQYLLQKSVHENNGRRSNF